MYRSEHFLVCRITRYHLSLWVLIGFLVICLLSETPAIFGGTIYATSGSGKIYKDSTGNGTAFQLIGNTPVVFADLAYNPSTNALFAVAKGTRDLYADATGTGTDFQYLATATMWHGQTAYGLAFDTVHNYLFMSEQATLLVDKSGAGTNFTVAKDSLPAGFFGLAFDATSSTLYASTLSSNIYRDGGSQGQFWTAAFTNGVEYTDVAYNYSTHTLFASNANGIYQDSTNHGGSFSFIGTTPETFVGMTYAIPEPSTIVLLATGLASLLFVAWRRKWRETAA